MAAERKWTPAKRNDKAGKCRIKAGCARFSLKREREREMISENGVLKSNRRKEKLEKCL